MYTAKIVSKEFTGGALRVSVEFTDGVTTVMEQCIPQDEAGFKHWVKSRLETFNGAQEIDTKYVINDDIDVSEVVVTPPVLTAQEIARDAWLVKYRKYVKIKTTLIDTGIMTGSEPGVVSLRNSVTNDLLPAYLDFI